MSCVQIPDLPLAEFGSQFIEKFMSERVPISGSIELDLRCNLRCLHCYRDGEWAPDILNTEEVCDILDQAAAAGTLWILLTGGEVFLRPDFFEIYEHAIGLGMKVSIFTNGTMVTERIADRLVETPPYGIEITLYGYSTETYENVTGVPGSREQCYRGAELLIERNLPVAVKTVLIETNKHEFMDMFNYAKERKLRFKYDTMVTPNRDGTMSPCNLRLSPKEAVELEFSIAERVDEYMSFYEPRKSVSTSRVFSCGAGSRTFHVDPYGNMKMCILLPAPEFSLKHRSFKEIWNDMFPPVYNQMREADHHCNDCQLSSLCEKCPAWSIMEKGQLEARVEYTCEVGHRRAQRLGVWDGPVDQYSSTLENPSGEVLLPVLQTVGGGCK